MSASVRISLLETIALSIFAIALRALIAFAASRHGHISLASYTTKADTASYIAYAGAMSGEQTYQSLDEYDRRVFPGYPAIIAAVHLTKIPLSVAALLVTWISAGVATFAATRFFDDRRVAYAMLCLIPHYLINSSLGMSEAPLLAATTVGLLLAKNNRYLFAGLLLGYAGLIRPMACFAVAGLLLSFLIDRKYRAAIITTLTTLAIFVTGFQAIQHWTGDALQGTRVYAHNPGAYNGHLFLWPFQSLIQTPFQEPTSIGRIIYTWAHVIITLTACVLSLNAVKNKSRSDPQILHSALCTPHSALFPTWLCGNTLFVLCIGSAWGFRHFPRFTIPAEPAMFFVLRRWLPSDRLIWFIIVAACSVPAVIGVETSP